MSSISSIHINDLKLWAHVGVLDHERLYGQFFLVELTLWIHMIDSEYSDDLSKSIDYSVAIRALQELSKEIYCQTIEYFSTQILDCLERIYGPIPIKLKLIKCSAPIPGFNGQVAIERSRLNGFQISP